MTERPLPKKEGYLIVETNNFTINTFFDKTIRLSSKTRSSLDYELFKRVKNSVEEWNWEKFDWDYNFENGNWFFGKYYGNIKVEIYEYKPTPELLKKREEFLIEREKERKRQREYRERCETIKQLKAEYPDYIKTSFSEAKPKAEIDSEKIALYQKFMNKYRDEMFNVGKFSPSCPNCGANAWENNRCTYCGTKII